MTLVEMPLEVYQQRTSEATSAGSFLAYPADASELARVLTRGGAPVDFDRVIAPEVNSDDAHGRLFARYHADPRTEHRRSVASLTVVNTSERPLRDVEIEADTYDLKPEAAFPMFDLTDLSNCRSEDPADPPSDPSNGTQAPTVRLRVGTLARGEGRTVPLFERHIFLYGTTHAGSGPKYAWSFAVGTMYRPRAVLYRADGRSVPARQSVEREMCHPVNVN